MDTDTQHFEEHRPTLVAHAYRMLGDMGRVEELVQETWLRWQGRTEAGVSPKAWLLKVATNLCLNELDSARARQEEARGDRLPEPVDLAAGPLSKLEMVDQISMAFLVMLQRLTAAERAVLLLHDVFDFSHTEIGELLGKNEAASRQLLKRAKESVATERRSLVASRQEHERILHAFLAAAGAGEVDALSSLLAEDVVLRADGGPNGVGYGRIRNLPGPLTGAARVAAFIAATTPEGTQGADQRIIDVNGSPALLVLRDGRLFAVVMISVEAGKVRRVFVQADPSRLGRLRG